MWVHVGTCTWMWHVYTFVWKLEVNTSICLHCSPVYLLGLGFLKAPRAHWLTRLDEQKAPEPNFPYPLTGFIGTQHISSFNMGSRNCTLLLMLITVSTEHTELSPQPKNLFLKEQMSLINKNYFNEKSTICEFKYSVGLVYKSLNMLLEIISFS